MSPLPQINRVFSMLIQQEFQLTTHAGDKEKICVNLS